MSKHTPGPWGIDDSDDTFEIVSASRGDGIIPIAEVMTGFEGPIEDEQQANAHLIAAAPEMLSELRGVLEWARVEKAPLRQIEIDSIAALIAKAEGRK